MIKKAVSILAFVLPSSISRMLFRLAGHGIGKNVKMSFFSYIYAGEIEIGNDVDIRPLVFINVSKLVLGNSAIISYGTNIKGDKGFYTKDNSFIGPHCLVNCDEDVKIGFYSGLGPRCTVYTHGSFLPVTEGYPVKFEKVVLEDRVWTGMEVTLLPGAYIESNCIINPGVIIKSRIRANSIVEVSPGSFQIQNLNRLRTFLKKDNSFYHKDILTKFPAYYNYRYEHNDTDNSCLIENKYLFKYIPEDNTMELLYGNGKKVRYDLGNYYVDDCKLEIHKKFLFFLRRRYGITLRTRY
jgi:acetyltransferase-like isoleucine patch superfamily enzyme